ncbi:MAG TPA: hypothetical protein VEM96_19245 [Pyrinomonadaceae bacterium]|nr:hypothetical protein [Pyrinomonadaceae bacterium]
MNVEVQARKSRRETVIENAIIARPDLVGFPGALAIRNFRLADSSGAVDVVLIPQGGPVRLVLVEAKSASAADAGCKVVGQLLMYYAGALTFGLDGVELLRKFAQNFQDDALSIPRISPQKVIDKVLGARHPNTHCFELLTTGIHLTPKEVALFVALNDKPHHVLLPLLRMLRESHALPIGLVVVRGGEPELVLSAG